jgi:TPR repeat protein
MEDQLSMRRQQPLKSTVENNMIPHKFKSHLSYASLVSMAAFAFVALISIEAQASAGTETARREYDRGNYAGALQQLQPLADAGDTGAQVLLGTMYANGRGVPKDDVQADAWFWKAATAANMEAQLAIASAYADGRGVPQNDDLADYWKWKAAVNFAAIEKGKLDAEVAKLPTVPSGSPKNTGPAIELDHCQPPAYRRSGYGYHHSETLQMLFLIDPKGNPVEATLLEKSDWAELDHAFLLSYSKTCTFKPAVKDGKPVNSLYKLAVTWTVDP